ncbi:neutral zinc metallopeptidase [Nocardiopsis quinghaiensis]|uniref:neutral zinc metallopeptidase n=1 Tax=Nocardiopsis quinghaiensis TaxID=464995 RepID=UPI0029589962|nr:neutral zinc metallopeptidase [Nocardiopsis quinghaiensis]
MPGPQYAPGVPASPHPPLPQSAPGAHGAQMAGAPTPHTHPYPPPHTLQPGAYPGAGWQQPGQPWGRPHAAARPRRRGLGVLVGSSAAAVIALVALAASILMVVTTPREEPRPSGTDLSAHYDDRLAARPNGVEVDLVDHPLYGASVPEAVDCGTPDLDMGSDESWEEFATATGTCLDELWAPTLEEMGLSVGPLEFAVTQDSPDADGAEGYTLAYYESDLARITVVLPNVRHMGAQIPSQHREDVWLALMGHEYGHHVQYVTGILNISHDLRWNAGNEEDALDTLRRTELQAECMAGVGLRGITDADEETLAAVNANFNSGGDLDTHGSAGNRALWLERGWSEPTLDGCNTYGAEPGQVT